MNNENYVTWNQIIFILLTLCVLFVLWFLVVRPIIVLGETSLDEKTCINMAKYKFGDDVDCFAYTKPMYSKTNTPTECSCIINRSKLITIEVK